MKLNYLYSTGTLAFSYGIVDDNGEGLGHAIISFENGKFKKCDFPFRGTYTRKQWSILREIEAEITRIEQDVLCKQNSETNSIITWSPAKRGLPDSDTTVLVHLADGEVCTGFLDGDIWRNLYWGRIDAAVLHWADFPQPPDSKKQQ
jgi:hypothetical protein